MYRILIIEDDRTIANVLAEHLRTWDYEVHCVTNFKNVMEDFREYEPQLVLLDIVLPLFNGVPLVPGDPQDFKSTDYLLIIGK